MWSARLVHNLAFLVWVSGGAIIWGSNFDVIELNLIGLGTLSLIFRHLECKSVRAILAILSVVLKLCSPFIFLEPAKFGAFSLRVHFHATFGPCFFLLFCLVPAEMGDATLIVRGALLSILSISFALRLKRPFSRIMAVESFDAVFVLVAGYSILIADANFLAVARFALASHCARSARV